MTIPAGEKGLIPARVLVRPEDPLFQDQNRRWQGCAHIEATRGGRLFVSMFAGQAEEGAGCHVVVARSDDGGQSFTSPEVVVVHDDPACTTGGGVLWCDPLGRLWLFWVQSEGSHDGRQGVWCAICDNPDAENLTFSPPRRIANGFMSHKPTVLSNGDWLFPCCLWRDGCGLSDYNVRPELKNEQFSNVYISRDQGETITLYGRADIPNRQFDEHLVVEKQDGRLWMLARTFDGIGESFSADGGKSWSPGQNSDLTGPCSLFEVRRLASGRLLQVNHLDFGKRLSPEEVENQDSPVKRWVGRTNLTALLSEDDGATWPYALLLDGRDDVSYPDSAQGPDSTIYITYDYKRVTKREILMARITEEDIINGALASPASGLCLLVNKATGQPDVADRD